MRKAVALLGACLTLSLLFVQAQLPASADGEGISQAAFFKKFDKKARFGATAITREFSFANGTALNEAPIVTAVCKNTVELVAVDAKNPVGYTLPHTPFTEVKNYDFEVFDHGSFSSRKSAPEKTSLAGDNQYPADNYYEFYGYRSGEYGQRSRFTCEYAYTDARYLSALFFSEAFPVRSASYSFKIPDWLELDIREKNFEGYKIRKETRKEKGFVVYTYIAENLAAAKPEPASAGRALYLPHLVITVRSFISNQKKFTGLQSAADLYSWYHWLYRKAGNDSAAVAPLVQQLVQDKTSDTAKIKALYYWVQDNIRYLPTAETYAAYTPPGLQEVLNNKTADCRGIAHLLTAMLQQAGFSAHYAWAGTRDIPYTHADIPALCTDNHTLCVVYLNGKPLFLDATEKHLAYGKNAYRLQGKPVMVEAGQQFATETVPIADAAENNQYTRVDLTLKDNTLSGHIAISFQGQSADFFHYVYNNLAAGKRKDFISSLVQLGNKNAEVSNIHTSDFKNRDIPLSIEADVEITDQVTLVDSVYYTNMDFFPGIISGFIPDEERQAPIDMNAVFVSTDDIRLQLPAGTKAQTLPAKFTHSFQGNRLEASYETNGNTVLLHKTMQIGSPVIARNDFTAWKNFLDQVRAFDKTNVSVHL